MGRRGAARGRAVLGRIPSRLSPHTKKTNESRVRPSEESLNRDLELPSVSEIVDA